MESNHPTGGLLRPAGFEDRMGHQTPAAPGETLRGARPAGQASAELPRGHVEQRDRGQVGAARGEDLDAGGVEDEDLAVVADPDGLRVRELAWSVAEPGPVEVDERDRRFRRVQVEARDLAVAVRRPQLRSLCRDAVCGSTRVAGGPDEVAAAVVLPDLVADPPGDVDAVPVHPDVVRVVVEALAAGSDDVTALGGAYAVAPCALELPDLVENRDAVIAVVGNPYERPHR